MSAALLPLTARWAMQSAGKDPGASRRGTIKWRSGQRFEFALSRRVDHPERAGRPAPILTENASAVCSKTDGRCPRARRRAVSGHSRQPSYRVSDTPCFIVGQRGGKNFRKPVWPDHAREKFVDFSDTWTSDRPDVHWVSFTNFHFFQSVGNIRGCAIGHCSWPMVE